MKPKYFIFGFFGIGAALFIFNALFPAAQDPHSVQQTSGTQGAPLAKVTVPDLPPEANAGRAIFEANCAVCHGKNAAGSDGNGPPLIHRIYEPNHHGDTAFLLAAKNGVRAHHWQFGNMPPVADISEQEIAKIVTYVRYLQQANGIF